MPTKAEIALIETAFAQKYGLDLVGMKTDEARLRTLVTESPRPNPADYTYYTYNGSEAFVPNLETTAFREITPDSRLSPRRVELNLEVPHGNLWVRNRFYRAPCRHS